MCYLPLRFFSVVLVTVERTDSSEHLRVLLRVQIYVQICTIFSMTSHNLRLLKDTWPQVLSPNVVALVIFKLLPIKQKCAFSS